KKVCVVNGDGDLLDPKGLCFPTETEASSNLQAITPQQKASSTPSVSPSSSPSPSASPAGPAPGTQYCLTSSTTQATYGCFKTQDQAATAQKGLSTKVTESVYCLGALASGATTSPTP